MDTDAITIRNRDPTKYAHPGTLQNIHVKIQHHDSIWRGDVRWKSKKNKKKNTKKFLDNEKV